MCRCQLLRVNLVANTETVAQGDRDGSTGGKVAVISQAEISCGRLKRDTSGVTGKYALACLDWHFSGKRRTIRASFGRQPVTDSTASSVTSRESSIYSGHEKWAFVHLNKVRASYISNPYSCAGSG